MSIRITATKRQLAKRWRDLAIRKIERVDRSPSKRKAKWMAYEAAFYLEMCANELDALYDTCATCYGTGQIARVSKPIGKRVSNCPDCKGVKK